MTRQLLYVAEPVRPTEQEIAVMSRFVSDDRKSLAEQQRTAALRANLDRAMRWLDWLRRSFPETTFIAPWIASILAGADDSDPAQREAGMQDNFAVIERSDGIVLCGGRISEGMQREREHGRMYHQLPRGTDVNPFKVYDLTSYQIDGASGRSDDRRTFAQWMRGYQESCTR